MFHTYRGEWGRRRRGFLLSFVVLLYYYECLYLGTGYAYVFSIYTIVNTIIFTDEYFRRWQILWYFYWFRTSICRFYLQRNFVKFYWIVLLARRGYTHFPVLNDEHIKEDFELVHAMPGWSHRGDQQYEFGEKCLRASPALDLTNGFFVAVFRKKRKTHHWVITICWIITLLFECFVHLEDKEKGGGAIVKVR